MQWRGGCLGQRSEVTALISSGCLDHRSVRQAKTGRFSLLSIRYTAGKFVVVPVNVNFHNLVPGEVVMNFVAIHSLIIPERRKK